jgi:pullulanase
MGIFDVETMNLIRAELDKSNPGLFLYGEGWAADQSPMPEHLRAVKNNTPQMSGIASFNDDFRDGLKGNHGSKKSTGFINGLELGEEPVKFGIVGATHHPQIIYDYIKTSNHAWAAEPSQCINYVSCHDNYTLWDKLKMSRSKASDEELRKMVKLAGALVLTSQGVPFLHAGVEFCRSKGGNGNSYKSPDSVNQIDWERKSTYNDVFEYYQKLIQLRKNHPAFRITKADQIRENLNFCLKYKMGVVSYCLDGEKLGDSWKKIILIFNANPNDVEIQIPKGSYKLVASAGEIDEKGMDEIISEEITATALSVTILVQS